MTEFTLKFKPETFHFSTGSTSCLSKITDVKDCSLRRVDLRFATS